MKIFEILTEAKVGKQAMDYKRSNRYPDGESIPDSLPPRYQPASFPGVPAGQKCSNCMFYDTDSKKCSKFKGDPIVRPAYWCLKWAEYKEEVNEGWSQKYKNSINCSHPKGFSQKAHCAGKKKHNESIEMEHVCPDCGMCESHGNINEIKKGQKDSNGFTKCWPGKHADGTKKSSVTGKPVRNCVPNEVVDEGYGKYWCSTDKKWKERQGPKQTRESIEVDESLDELARVLELSGLDLTADEQFDIIEEMVEQLALEHGVDPEVIWEDFESVEDDELLESAAWHRSAGKNKNGGLNRKGVMSYRREHPGSKLQTAVTTKPSKLKPGSKAAKRRKSFCARMGGMKGPMKKPNGKPTRKALALRKWNC